MVAAMLMAMDVGKSPPAALAAADAADAATFEQAHGLVGDSILRPPKVGTRVSHTVHGRGVLTAINDMRPPCVYNAPCMGQTKPYRVEYENSPASITAVTGQEDVAERKKTKSTWKTNLKPETSRRARFVVDYASAASAAEVDGVPVSILALL